VFSQGLGIAPYQPILGCHIADRAMETLIIIVPHKPIDQLTGIFQRQWRCRPDAITLDRLMPALDLAIPLWAIGCRSHVGHATQVDVRISRGTRTGGR